MKAACVAGRVGAGSNDSSSSLLPTCKQTHALRHAHCLSAFRGLRGVCSPSAVCRHAGGRFSVQTGDDRVKRKEFAFDQFVKLKSGDCS